MPRYADLIDQAFEGSADFVIHRVSLARPPGILGRMPSPLRTLAHHASVFFSAIQLNRRPDFDLFHVIDGSHGYVIPRLNSRPTTVTVHDVIPALQAVGRFNTDRPGRAARGVIHAALRGIDAATAIACDSVSSRNDLVLFKSNAGSKALIINPPLESIFIKPCTIDENPKQSESIDGKRAADCHNTGDQAMRIGEPTERPFIFHIGNNAFYKNRMGVLEVFARFANRVSHRLVMAGPPPNDSLIDLAEQLKVRDRVDFWVDPTDDVVRWLYRNASLLLFPSVYEGFGWPPLEAMASGCPVVCSDGGSLAEVVGDAAMVFAWDDTDSMAEAAVNVLNDPVVAARMKAAGRTHAAQFTLERFGRELRQLWIDALTKS